MSELSGIEKFKKCIFKGYRSCSHYDNPAMRHGIAEDVPEANIPVSIRTPSLEAEERAAKLCEYCSKFKPISRS